MTDHSMLQQALVYLLAMIVVVPLSKWMGLGAVLGYLVAGVLLGPGALGWIADSQTDASHLAEFGVIMMLLLIGLELNPRILWKMRGPILGLGGAQVVLTSAAFAAIAMATGQPWQSALVIGMVTSVSSTAIVLQTLTEKGLRKSVPGERAFAVLLFQDIAVIPMLALLPFLASSMRGPVTGGDAGRPGWLQALIVLGAIVALIAGGRLIVRPAFHWIARLGLREILTAAALLLVVGTTALMQMVGLSPALGAFLAGVVLADSEFRHQIEADLEPFKALLLGLFFISIGAGVDLGVVAAKPMAIAGIVTCLLFIKGAIVFALGKFSKLCANDAVLLGVSLAQGGEFAFVLLGLAREGGLMASETTQLLTASVAMSMAAAPLLIAATIKWLVPLLSPVGMERPADVIDEHESHAIVVGIGRFGQLVVRILRGNGFKTTVLDFDEEQIKVMERFGIRAYFGDGTRPELLRAAGIANVKIIVVAVDNQESALAIVESVKAEHPHVQIYARAFDRVHAYKLKNAGAHAVVIETGGSAVDLGVEVLKGLGYSAYRAQRQGGFFHRRNRQTIDEMAPIYAKAERKDFVREARQRIELLEGLLKAESTRHGVDDSAWESAPVKEPT